MSVLSPTIYCPVKETGNTEFVVLDLGSLKCDNVLENESNYWNFNLNLTKINMFRVYLGKYVPINQMNHWILSLILFIKKTQKILSILFKTTR